MIIGNVIKGLEIFVRHLEDGENAFAMSAEHDEIYVGPINEMSPILEDELEELRELGWHLDEELGAWKAMV